MIGAAPDRFEVHAVDRQLELREARRDGAEAQGAPRRRRGRGGLQDACATSLFGSGISAAAGVDAMEEAAAEPVDIVLSAIVGAAGLKATAAAIRAGSDIALANKECLICAGSAFMALAREHNVRVLPVDSEHNALYQLIDRRDAGRHPHLHADGVRRPVPHLVDGAHRRGDPAAGGRASDLVDGRQDLRRFRHADEQGPGADRGASPLRPCRRTRSTCSCIRSRWCTRLITFRDGSIHAELGAADMRRPIGYCLHWPERVREPVATLDLAAVGAAHFRARRTPSASRRFGLAMEALKQGGGAATVLNAANEVAVEAFLANRIAFTAIPQIVEIALTAAESEGLLPEPASIEEALALDAVARKIARADLKRRSAA